MGTTLRAPLPDAEVFDAYSRAVIGVVDRVGPAVVSLAVRRWRGEGAGSGFLIAPDGLVLTNSHVVHGAARVQVRLRDGRELSARVIGADPATDLAVARVPATSLPHVALDADTSAVPGQLAIAIGNPLGFDSTVSAGVVSAIGRALWNEGHAIDDLVQHTAPLNPGSSGGPLLGSDARVLGVNTAVISRSQGIGFAIPATTASWVAGQLLAHGRVRRSVIGIAGSTRPLSGALRRLREEGAATAVEVRDVKPDGPADRAGVRAGDVLLRLDERAIETVTQLSRSLSRLEPGREVSLLLARDARAITARLRPVLG